MKSGNEPLKWPVLRRYRGEYLRRISLPCGGIGTGTIGFGGRGDLRDWEVANRPAKGFAPSPGFFVVRARPAGSPPMARLLEGPLDPADFEGSNGAPISTAGFPRFRSAEFLAAYPFGQVALSDPEFPLRARIQAFNPLIPGDLEASSFPAMLLRVILCNPGSRPVEASVCGALRNFIGTDGANGKPCRNRNRRRGGNLLRGIFFDSEGVAPKSEWFGTFALAVRRRHSISRRLAWAPLSWGNALLDFWDDLLEDGTLEERPNPEGDAPRAALSVRLRVPPRCERAVEFFLAWHFPNRRAWARGSEQNPTNETGEIVGNHYAVRFADAWDAAERLAAALPRLERRTAAWVGAFCASDLPDEVKEAALNNLSTLRSQTCFRTADGHFFAWEGCNDREGCCSGSCTHVWNYELTLPYLFPELARDMRRVEFLHALREDGLMNFRVQLPLEKNRTTPRRAAADGQMGCLVKLYREWQISGDDDFLRELWPAARKALEFCWIPGGWDADQDGVMEGCQHNTMDVDYFGPNPQMGFWYLAALRAAERMARHLGETEFAEKCGRLAAAGGPWMDEHLFNGDYYEQEIRPPRDAANVASGLACGLPLEGEHLADPLLQLGAGCLVDQLVGQLHGHLTGLGYLANPRHVRKTLLSILRHNWRGHLYGHFNHLRAFALQDEAAVLMASYPRGRRPAQPFPYYNEVMTGFEYTLAVHLLCEGEMERGLRVFRAVRARYDGRRRNPFDEAECGHHYGRALAAWGGVLALTGFRYSARDRTLSIRVGEGRFFWCVGDAFGVIERRGEKVRLRVMEGALPVERVELCGVSRNVRFPLKAGARLGLVIRAGGR